MGIRGGSVLVPGRPFKWNDAEVVILLLLYYRRISSIRGPATYAGGARPAALTHSGVLFPYRQEYSQLSSKVASVVVWGSAPGRRAVGSAGRRKAAGGGIEELFISYSDWHARAVAVHAMPSTARSRGVRVHLRHGRR